MAEEKEAKPAAAAEEPEVKLTAAEEAAIEEGQELAERLTAEAEARPDDHELVVAEKAAAEAEENREPIVPVEEDEEAEAK